MDKTIDDEMIKNLIIDFGGVLIDLDRPRCLEHFRRLGVHDIDRMLGECAKEGFLQDYETGLITSDKFRSIIRSKIDGEVSDAQIDEAWNSFLVGIPENKLELLLRLRKEYTVYLLSNTNEIHWLWSVEHAFPYRGFRVEDYFERIYLSYELKVTKPEARIFRMLLEDTGINPAETLFIDDAADNCRVAEQLGISTYTPKLHEDWSHLFS